MKASYLGLAVVGLAVAGLWYAGGGAAVPPSAAAAELPRVSAPLSHDNLTVFFVHGRDAVDDTHKVATLQEALEAGWAVVHETGDVNTLAVENRSADYELFVQDGEMVKGGRQDRMIAGDMLIPPKSGVVPFPAHCVEHGRWTGRGGEAVASFHTSNQFAVGNELRLANASYQQGAVWDNVKKNQDKLSRNLGTKVNDAASESSFQLALENKTLQDRIAAFEAALKAAGAERRGVIGVVFVVNGQVTAAEVYGSNALFQKAWPKLLRSQAAGAVADKTDRPCPPAPTAREVERFLALAGTEQPAPTDADVAAVATEVDRTANRVQETRAGQFLVGGAVNTAENVTGRVNDLPAFRGRSGATRSRLVTNGGGQGANPNASPALNRTNEDPGLQVGFQAALPELNRADNIVDNRNPGRPRPVAVNPDGNRLTVNRVDNAAGLTTEARDPGRGNAVIHKSFIKK